MYDSVVSAHVLSHGLNPSNHSPVSCTFKVQSVVDNATQNVKHKPKTAWYKASKDNINNYSDALDSVLCNITIPVGVLCRDVNCYNPEHRQSTDNYTETLIDCIIAASECLPKTCPSKKLPFWKERVKPLRDKALFWHRLWCDNGKPQNGIIADIMRSTRKLYHKEVKSIQRQITNHRNEKMANAVASNTSRKLWDEIRKMDKGAPMANIVDGKTDCDDIANVFATKYKTLYNSVGYHTRELNDVINVIEDNVSKLPPSDSTHYVSVVEVTEAIKMLNSNKCDGNQGIFTNHFKNAPIRLAFDFHVSQLFSSMLTHGCTPEELSIATLTSIPKDLQESITNSNNYRGIALGSIFCKIYDTIMINRYSDKLNSSNLQFAYKNQHSTTQCSNLVKETADHYVKQGGCIYTCMLDASKAFDRIDFVRLFKILMKRNLPPVIIRSIINLYTSQQMRASWKGHMSEIFSVTNGTKQGAILSCSLFCVYLDELLREIKTSGYGCKIGNMFVGALAYADDVSLSSPTLTGLQKMVNICDSYGMEYNVPFNPKKTICMKISKDGKQPIKHIMLNNKPLTWVEKAKHLGNWLNSTNSDSLDIKSKSGQLIGATNKLIVKFPSVSFQVKRVLFQSYCTSYYGCQSWLLTNVDEFDTTWRKVIRRLFSLPWQTHCSLLPVILNQDSACVSIEKQVCKYIHCGLNSQNDVISYVFNRGTLECKGLLGQNMKHLNRKYGITKQLLSSDIKRAMDIITKSNKPSVADTITASIITELLSCDIPILMQEEIDHVIQVLCTQ